MPQFIAGDVGAAATGLAILSALPWALYAPWAPPLTTSNPWADVGHQVSVDFVEDACIDISERIKQKPRLTRGVSEVKSATTLVALLLIATLPQQRC